MDEQRFDQFSRRLGSSQTRRQALRALAGALVAGVVGTTTTEAQTPCIAKNKSCQSDGQCCDGMVCEWGMCKPGCRIDGEFAHPKKSPAGNTCVVCQPEISTTTGMPTKEGKRCWSGDPAAGETTCQNGVCASDEPISCPPLTACHLEGEVNPATGLCEYPPAPEGTLCGAAEMCHGGFYSPAAACDGTGHCIGGGTKTVNCAPYPCAGSSCATSCATNNDCVNGAACCNGECVYLNSVDHCGSCGTTCEAVDACTPAYCDNGTCNETSACPSGTGCCNGQCVSLNTIDDCGTCGNICDAVDTCTPADCSNGTCNEISACPDGTGCCNGQCVSLNTIDDCGTCGNICDAVDTCTPADCSNGMCNEVSTCGPDETCCGDQCADLDLSNDHCGACGVSCPTEYACLDGSCYKAYPYCNVFAVAANGGGVNVCHGFPATGQLCETTSECGTGEVCGLAPGPGGTYIGRCYPGYPL